MKPRPPLPKQFSIGWPPGFVPSAYTPEEVERSRKSRRCSEVATARKLSNAETGTGLGNGTIEGIKKRGKRA